MYGQPPPFRRDTGGGWDSPPPFYAGTSGVWEWRPPPVYRNSNFFTSQSPLQIHPNPNFAVIGASPHQHQPIRSWKRKKKTAGASQSPQQPIHPHPNSPAAGESQPPPAPCTHPNPNSVTGGPSQQQIRPSKKRKKENDQQIHQNPDFVTAYASQSPKIHPNTYFANFADFATHQQQQTHLNHSLFPDTELFQSPSFSPHRNQFLPDPKNSPSTPQTSNFLIPFNPNISNFQTPCPDTDNSSHARKKLLKQSKIHKKTIIENLDKAVKKAHHELLDLNENVSSWNVSQMALLMVKAESWESLGYRMQQVPSLNRLLLTERQINAFIHAFIAVREITSLYELGVAICESKHIKQFEELELGPLVRHPLVVHYFSLTSDVTEVYRITIEEIVSYLCEFTDTHKKKEVQIDAFLDFISKKQSVSSREKLCMHIRGFGSYIKYIKQLKHSKCTILRSVEEARKIELNRKKCPLPNESLEMFVTTWKETCRENDEDEVLERMLQFYNAPKNKKVKAFLKSYPFVGLLHAAVTFIKFVDKNNFKISADYISIEVEPAKKNAEVSAHNTLTQKHGESLEAHLLPLQLDVLLSQVLSSWSEIEITNLKNVSELLARQFSTVCFKPSTDLVGNLVDILREKGRNLTSNSILFSTPLLKLNHVDGPLAQNKKNIGSITTKDAVEVLQKAPLLTDLRLWSHWDHLFAHSLGSLVEWLLNEVNIEELLCLVTKDAKVIRINRTATINSFSRVLNQESPSETAAELLSLFVLYGGERNAPLLLLKFHARQAFEAIINKSPEINKVAPVLSRFILDCLGFFPTEFCSFAADVLVSGLQFLYKDTPSAILRECRQMEEFLMLYEVGLTLGITEWVNDYHSFNYSPGSSCLDVVNIKSNTGSLIVQQDVSNSHTQPFLSCDISFKLVSNVTDSVDNANSGLSLLASEIDFDPVKVIESIRYNEFGLHQSENKMLENQHARLVRELHCLSQELYSQDSHFLLELVQNADDNVYPNDVEPTLTFILEEKNIIVLNNERGFLPNNIRALCDIGNSTKRGHNAGFIGKKGIGFKSVFRVTDGPEIHSNGFHIKFDISKGQIGFVLPTIVPPRDINLFTRMASTDSDKKDENPSNTCIILPFRSNKSEALSMTSIASMFSDLHPSLLLFLNRLQCIKFRNMLEDSTIVMRKEVTSNGIVNISLGKEKMTWFVISQKLQANFIRPDVQSTEISMAFSFQETDGGDYSLILNPQPVFAFLPLRTCGLKFIIQGDFDLPSSRDKVDESSPWNQWLLSEFPDLFISGKNSFCELPSFRGSPGKAVTAFMSFVPLVGEVHGFFSSISKMIILKLRESNCLLLDNDEKEWVPPCKVLRNWTDQTRSLLPDSLLNDHLALGFLNKDIILSDSLARALGVEDYGPKILLRVISSLCQSDEGLNSMGLSWLSSWLNALYESSTYGTETDLIKTLQKISFIPLSDGQYGSVDKATIWLHSDTITQGINDELVFNAFPKLYAKLRTVSPNLLTSCSDSIIVENVRRMLSKIGIQELSAHEIVKMHILPAISNEKNAIGQEELMVEYLSFAMLHLQSVCVSCHLERDGIIAELCHKALILTNHGFKRSNEVVIHFNPNKKVRRLIGRLDLKWHEIDPTYMKHPGTEFISGGVSKWRAFFQEMGVTDFVKIIQVEKSVVAYTSPDDITGGKDIISVAKNWESEELCHLLSQLTARTDGASSKYLLEILDNLWGPYFGDKVTGYYTDSNGEFKSFKSSVISILQDVPWLGSNIDDKLHFAKDLFHDSVEVNSVLGVSAPYTVSKVRTKKLISDIGLKTQVTLDDALSVLKLWRRSDFTFKASVSQMSNFYAFLSKGMHLSKKKILEVLKSGPFIFVPYTYGCSHEDAVPGTLLSPEDVYWHDGVGAMDQVRSECFNRKMLCNLYPNVHDFFINECGVDETPPLREYLDILLQLSNTSSPHLAAKRVSEVFLRWSDALKSGLLSLEDVNYLKENLLKKEYTVLSTRQNKWVSLHESFGLICWSDDENLLSEFKNQQGVDFIYFGESTDEENQVLLEKVSNIIQALGIPALSEIVTREAIYHGPSDCGYIFFLMNWILPYAQRYIFNAHPEKYFQLKQSGFENLRQLKIVVIENLFYRSVIRRYGITSKKRHACNCLLQDNTLYCSQESDSHTIFLEFSRLLYNGIPELNFANFLHMITTMAESGVTEFFTLNSLKVPKLPDEESSWSLQSTSLSDGTFIENCFLKKNEQKNSIFKKRRIIDQNWQPSCSKASPGLSSGSAFVSEKTVETYLPFQVRSPEENLIETEITPAEISPVYNIEDDQMGTSHQGIVLNSKNSESNPYISRNFVTSVDIDLYNTNNFPQQPFITGRLGEHFASKYFVEKFGDSSVNWVNKLSETGLPYDIIIGDETSREYIEVKATQSIGKKWFFISIRELQFAIEKGESFSIAHVVLTNNGMPRLTVYKNPARLCQLGNLKLSLMVPK